jgi:Sel1 repeat
MQASKIWQSGPSVEDRRVLLSVTFLLLICLFGGTPPARADAKAGREAYDKGDYARAAAEWQNAADRDEADAQLGIGSLYEFGLGNLPQDYDRANYWYQKAASHGNTEAQYRLALIWAAGSAEFPRNLVESYKWVALATDSKGVWGTVASDLKTQLDKVMRPDEREAAIKRSKAWKEALNALSVVPASPPPGIAGKPGATGCPGWPFPTLPCTEQPPPIPGKQAPPQVTSPTPPPAAASLPKHPPANTAKTSLDELNAAMMQIDCASLQAQTSAQGSPLIFGTVSDTEQRARLVQVAGRLFPNNHPVVNVDIVPPPLCRSLVELNLFRLTGLASDGGVELHLANGGVELRENDPIAIQIRGPAYAADLRIDYFSLDDRVLHLWPNKEEPTARLAAGKTRVFGQVGSGKTWRAGGAPFGTEIISVIATAGPLDLGVSRPDVETAADYLRDLRRALDRIGQGVGAHSSMATLLVKTRGR